MIFIFRILYILDMVHIIYRLVKPFHYHYRHTCNQYLAWLQMKNLLVRHQFLVGSQLQNFLLQSGVVPQVRFQFQQVLLPQVRFQLQQVFQSQMRFQLQQVRQSLIKFYLQQVLKSQMRFHLQTALQQNL